MVHVSNINHPKSIYYTYFHSIIKYGIILGGNSLLDGKIFTLSYKMIRTMAGVQPTTSCSSLFKLLEILRVPCQYTLPLMNFIFNDSDWQKEINLKNVCNKNNLLVYNSDIQYQITSSVSAYVYRTIKNSLNTHFISSCLLHSPVGVSLIIDPSSIYRSCDSAS
jgi:hypothetical protein